MANTNVFPKSLGDILPVAGVIALTAAEDTIKVITGFDAQVLGQTMGGAAQPGFRSRTAGRRIQFVADAAWAIEKTSGAIGTKKQIAAGQTYTTEVTRETETYYVQAVTTANLKIEVTA